MLSSTVVDAAGNDGLDLSGAITATPGEVEGHITVGATGIRPAPRFQPGVSTDVRAYFSNYGAPIDVAAPGGDCGVDGGCPTATRPPNWAEYLVLSTVVAPNANCARTRTCAVV